MDAPPSENSPQTLNAREAISSWWGEAICGGAVEHGPRLFSQPTCHHAPELYGGIREQEAAALLQDFFRLRR
jgi:tRNA(Arg) A34 adenosine deaminase TadA